MMSGAQLTRGVSFLDILPQTPFLNSSEFLISQNGSNVAHYPVLLGVSDARNQSFPGTELNTTVLKKNEFNSFYFYKVSRYFSLIVTIGMLVTPSVRLHTKLRF